MQTINTIILKIKIFIKLHYTYARSEKYKKIKSILSNSIKVGNDIVIEENVEIGSFLKELSDGVYIGKGTYIGACDKIGKYCSISSDVKIGLISHPLNYISTSPIFYNKRRGWVTENNYDELNGGCTQIGNDVLISANVMILAGVKIGDGAVIGAGAFVNKDIPNYAIVAGVPAKIIKYRFDEEQIICLEKMEWWNMSKNQLLENKDSFSNINLFLNTAIKNE